MADANILDFGADPTGQSDSTVAIQTAFDTGKSIFIPDGTYIATSLTMATSGVRIYGKGLLKKKAEVDGILLKLTGSNNLLDGLAFDGSADQPSRNQTNDILRITGHDNVVRNCQITGSFGGGIAILNAARNQILNNIIKSVHDNSILVGNIGADDNLILGNYCEGTIAQNNIFLTADSSSGPTANYIYRNRVIGNTCKGAGDTAIEVGQHNRGALVGANYAQGAVNPPILIRDSLDWSVTGNIVECLNCTDGMAVVPQNETASFPARGSISSNRVLGKANRSYIYIGNYDVKVIGNYVSDTVTPIAANGSNLTSTGILVAGSINNIEIIDNTINGVSNGVATNLVATVLDSFFCTGNSVSFVNVALNFGSTTFLTGCISGNTFRRCVTFGINLLSSGGSYLVPLCRNIFNLDGFSGAAPIRFNATHEVLGTFLSSEVERSAPIPATQYGAEILIADAAISTGILSLEFSTGEFAIIAIYPQSGSGDSISYSAIKNSAAIHMVSTGFTDWAVTKASYGIILQRRGGTISAPGSFKWRYDSVTPA